MRYYINVRAAVSDESTDNKDGYMPLYMFQRHTGVICRLSTHVDAICHAYVPALRMAHKTNTRRNSQVA
jgi:hypothetical protein